MSIRVEVGVKPNLLSQSEINPVTVISEKDRLIQQVRQECAAFKKPAYFPFLKAGIVVTVITGIAGVIFLEGGVVISCIGLIITLVQPLIRRSSNLKRLQEQKICQYQLAPVLQDLQEKCVKFKQKIKNYTENPDLSLQELKQYYQQINEDAKKDILPKKQEIRDALHPRFDVYITTSDSRFRCLEDSMSRSEDINNYYNGHYEIETDKCKKYILSTCNSLISNFEYINKYAESMQRLIQEVIDNSIKDL